MKPILLVLLLVMPVTLRADDPPTSAVDSFETLLLRATSEIAADRDEEAQATLDLRPRIGQTETIERAANEALKSALPDLIAQINQVPWRGRVVQVTDDRVFINAGVSSGITAGLRLEVLEGPTQILDPETNEVLGQAEEVIAHLRIDSVQNRTASALRPPGPEIQVGDIVRLVPNESLED